MQSAAINTAAETSVGRSHVGQRTTVPGRLGQPQVAVEGLVVRGVWSRLHFDEAGVDSLSQKRSQGAGLRQGEAQLARVEQDGRALHGVLGLVLKAEDAIHDASVGPAVVEKPEDGAVVVDLDERARDRESLGQVDDSAWVHGVRAPSHDGHAEPVEVGQ